MTSAEYRPDDLAAFKRKIDELERKVQQLALRAPLQAGSISDDDGNIVVRFNRDGLSVQDGRIAIVDEDGIERLVFGRFREAGPDGTFTGPFREPPVYGMALLNEDGDGVLTYIATDGTIINGGDGTQIFKTDPAKSALVRPDFTSTWQVRQAGDQRVTTSAAFETAWAQHLGRLVHDVMVCSIVVHADPGTTGQLRIRELITGNSTSIQTISGGATIQVQWLHGVPLNTFGRIFVIEVRRTGGAGNVACRPDSEMVWTSSDAFPGATGAGNWL